MTGRGMALMVAARRALAALPRAASVRIVRDRKAEDVPLAQQAAHLLQPVASEALRWPESQAWQYELTVFTLTTTCRGRPGTGAQARLAELHEAALAALRADEDLLEVVADGPPSARAALTGAIAGVRWGESHMAANRPGDPLAVTTTVGLGVWIDEPDTSATLDAAELFASGAHEIVAGSPERLSGERTFSGLAGALIVDLGRRPRTLVQRGRLSAASAESLAQLEAAIEARVDGAVHKLIARDGTEYPYVRLERFTRRGPVEVGLRYHRAYEIAYTEFLYGDQ